jgi:hypothetical protein
MTQLVNEPPGRLPGYPSGVPCAGGNPAVEGCGTFCRDKRAAAANVFGKGLIQFISLRFTNSGGNLNPVLR